MGFSGCAAYCCNGAGQRTLALFDGRSWQDDPALLAPQMACFRALRQLHEACELLVAAAALPLPPTAEAERLALLDALCPTQMTPEKASRLADGPLPGEVRRFLRTLGGHVPLRRPA